EKTRIQFREVGHRAPPRGAGEGMAGLTERELEIARHVARRKSNKAIGKELAISPRTVSTHLSNIFQKLDVASRAELGDLVREQGLLGE
ncbi:MAG TPA: LuxR C-terminal-related transcriptional regulator, partial [Longimicrobiales bacterium]|nr:LuxR C-terminal-related transcriptional regulator [Longimicrobiales bacterium]